jgi:tetratricopeptide (TPR) repeat protein
MGRCALLRNAPEEAAGYLQDAVNDMPRMDKYKREALYYLGNALEVSGKGAEAIENYKQILISMPDYRDVPARIQAIEAASVSAN